MVAYSFKSQFEAPIVTGRKAQTLRNDRKRHARAGEVLQLFCAMRTKQCRLIGRATCVSVLPIRIDFEEERVDIPGDRVIEARFDLDVFAAADGFFEWDQLCAFWAAEHPGALQWSGVIIRWEKFERAHRVKRTQP